MPTSLSLERMERIERLHKKYRDGVRKGIIVPQKYKAPTTPGRSSAKPQNRRILNKLPASSLNSGFFSGRADSLQPSSFSAGHLENAVHSLERFSDGQRRQDLMGRSTAKLLTRFQKPQNGSTI